jgi:multidrug efflux pump subunit AcrA (membrane-fusion protein)
LEGQAFEGRIIRTAPQIDKKHRTFIVKAKIDNSKWVLRPGMFIRAEIDSSDEQTPLWLPRSAVQGLDGAGPVFVFVVKDGMALKRNVLVGKTSADKIEIVKGLAKGDLAIIQGHDRIADLDEVSVEISENQLEPQ